MRRMAQVGTRFLGTREKHTEGRGEPCFRKALGGGEACLALQSRLGRELADVREAIVVRFTEQARALKGDGDFSFGRVSPLLAGGRFIITNPPFSLLFHFIELLVYNKRYPFVGSYLAMAPNSPFNKSSLGKCGGLALSNLYVLDTARRTMHTKCPMVHQPISRSTQPPTPKIKNHGREQSPVFRRGMRRMAQGIEIGSEE